MDHSLHLKGEVGVVLAVPNGEMHKLSFACINNEAEYKALIFRAHGGKRNEGEARSLVVEGDSNLMVSK